MGDVYQLRQARPESIQPLSDEQQMAQSRLAELAAAEVIMEQAQQAIELAAQANGGVTNAPYSQAA